MKHKTVTHMEATKYIAYYRVSTAKQGASGLGLDAQRSAVRAFTKCDACIVAEYTEVESGKNNQRPELARAMAQAKQIGATLVIAKLDRLSRNASFVLSLQDARVDFVCADMPQANTLTIGIMALLAQQEREMISKRTSAALQAKKEKGAKLGTPENLNDKARAKGMEVRQANAAQANAQAKELAGLYRAKGLTLQAIADKLNGNGYTTRHGKKFAPVTVKRLLGE